MLKVSVNTEKIQRRQKVLVFPAKIYLFIIPAIILFLVFWIFPIFQMFFYSVTDFNGINFKSFSIVGVKNFVSIFNDGTLSNSLKNTVVYTIIIVAASNILGLLIALLLNARIPGKGIFRTCCFLPTLFSAIVVGFIWSYVYMPGEGMISSFIKILGGDSETFNILGNYKTALYAIALVEIWKTFGYTMLIYLAGLQTVDENLLEAARIDGCNEIQSITHIKLPLLYFTITINTVLSVISGLKAFDYTFIMTNGGPGKSTNTLMFTIYKIAFSERQMGKASALSVVSFAFIVIVTIGLLAYMNRHEVEL
jgi:raffinose/stachyose/melibiose transport system permease protein